MEEMLDTYDVNGNFLGCKSRTFCHSENANCYHNAVWILIKNKNGKILIHKRAMTKKDNPGKWNESAVSGHVDAGETLLQACIRETQEELGIHTTPKDVLFLGRFLNQEGWEFGNIFLLTINLTLNEIIFDKTEIEQIKYVSYREFIKLLYSPGFCDEPKGYKDFIANVIK